MLANLNHMAFDLAGLFLAALRGFTPLLSEGFREPAFRLRAVAKLGWVAAVAACDEQ